jgi:leader peptidase (prepilin peptidase)/N-methyltransferase
VEAANGLLYLGIAVRWGPSAGALVAMALVTALLVLALIDLDHQILPNVITIPGIALGFLASLLPFGPSPLQAAVAAAGGYLGFAALARLYERSRGVEGLGQGDWKLAALLGAFLGGQHLLLVILLSSVAGTLVGLLLMATAGRSTQHKLPFGTFLGLAGIGVLFVGDAILAWYKGLLS